MRRRLTGVRQLASLEGAWRKGGRGLDPADLSLIDGAAVAFDEREVLWAGPEAALPPALSDAEPVDCRGLVVVPEVVDCHTHLVFAGDRAGEHAMRLDGADYREIARRGGGILSTARATRAASEEGLLRSARGRIERIRSRGVGAVEVKSGYGLDREAELRISRVVGALRREYAGRVTVRSTFLAAHAVPPEAPGPGAYMEGTVLPLLEELARDGEARPDAVDVFHEEGYFGAAEAEALYRRARELGIPVKCHADEFADGKAAVLACRHGALSADHLLMTGEDGVEALASSPTVAVLLPGTCLFLGKGQAPGRRLLDAGCRVAVGSDYNPGSCHIDDVLLCAFLAAPLHRMNTAELWAAVTLNAAAALGLGGQGALVPGLAPRFSFFRADSLARVAYSPGRNLAVWPEGYPPGAFSPRESGGGGVQRT